jgi:hypothetical protein
LVGLIELLKKEGFPRDYWVVATIILTVRPSISLTTSFTALMAAGTVVGALVAAVISIAVGKDLTNPDQLLDKKKYFIFALSLKLLDAGGSMGRVAVAPEIE